MQDRQAVSSIKQGIAGLETMTRFALAILALASGVYTYLGVRGLLDGSASQVFFAAIVYSSAVSVGIYAFWSYFLKFVPLIHEGSRRMTLAVIMGVGSLMIVAMSSWLNAAALAGSAAMEQHLAVTLEGYASDLDRAHARALSAQSLLPDVNRASERFKRLADEERRDGALTGTSGAGSVVQLLGQMGAQLDELSESIVASREKTQELFETGSKHLARMRSVVSAPGPVEPRSDQFAGEAVALQGVIASLQETSVAPSVRRAAEDLSLGFIAPVADGTTEDLAFRQNRVMDTVRASVETQSKALADAADDILNEPKVESRRFVPLSSAESVIRYASDFLPSWAGAISIDLLPAVLVFVLAVAHGAIRREASVTETAETITAAEMFRAVSLYRQMTGDEHLTEIHERASALERAREPAQRPADPEKTGSTAAAVRPLHHSADTDQINRIRKSGTET
ncbi:MAG: hypothetical protein H6888_05755 [Nitratireductor sp.]|nr:hypothetical protein [Nitratireductor sp.]MCC0020563.1 hypothetical protein [Nitratireductor sp.]